MVREANSASRKELEMNSLYSLLSCRIVEMNVPLKNNKLAFIGIKILCHYITGTMYRHRYIPLIYIPPSTLPPLVW